MTNTLPQVIYLCPVHFEEFYVKDGGICPVCDQRLVEYARAATNAKGNTDGDQG